MPDVTCDMVGFSRGEMHKSMENSKIVKYDPLPYNLTILAKTKVINIFS